jgi:glycosyltransferase involved in cell wall biosynthesis
MTRGQRSDSAPRRVLLVTQRPIDYGGGGSVRWRYLSHALPELGWDVVAVSARPNPTSDEASSDPSRAALAAARARIMNGVGGAVRPLFLRAGVQPEVFAPNLAWALTGRRPIARAIERARPDVVWATAPPQSAIFAAVAMARRAALPVVAELRDLWAGNPYFDAGSRWLSSVEEPALRGADAVVTVTPGCRENLMRLHPGLDVQLLPNGFDPALPGLRAGRSPRGHGEPLTLIHAGMLYGDRSAAALVRALARPDLRDRVRLELIGAVDPATREAIRGAGRSLPVTVAPPVGWAEAIDRVRASDVGVVINSPGTGGAMALPSKLYEALALGLPVLALTPPGSDTERLLRSLGQDTGIAPADDEEAIAAAVAGLLDQPPPPVPQERLAEYNREAVARRVAALLDSLAQGSARNRC